MSDTVKLEVGMAVSYIADSTNESLIDTGISRAEWDAMSEKERKEILNDYAAAEIEKHVDVWVSVANKE